MVMQRPFRNANRVRLLFWLRGQLHDEKLFALAPGFLPALCQRLADFVGVLRWFQRAGEACEDSGM
jgi:hypothetical protein